MRSANRTGNVCICGHTEGRCRCDEEGSQALQSPLLGVPLLAPHLHRRFFVIAPLLEFAEKAVLLHLPFEDLKGFLQVSVVYPYLQKL
jgi:hypothetical protein